MYGETKWGSLMRPEVQCSDIETELAIIGSLFVNNQNLAHVDSSLQPDHFSDQSLGFLYELIREGVSKGHVVTPLTLKPRLMLENGNDDLFKVAQNSTASAAVSMSLPALATSLRDLYVRRQAMVLTTDLYESARQTIADGNFTERLSSGLMDLSRLALYSQGRKSTLYTGYEASLSAIEAVKKAKSGGLGLQGISTGIRALDNITGGFLEEFVILGGRPSMGKTALALQVAKNFAMAGHGVYYYSGEMPKENIQIRNITSHIWTPEKSIAYADASRGRISDEELRWLEQGAAEIKAAPLFIEERPGITVEELEASIRVAKMRFEQKGIALKLIVVDHLHKMRAAKVERKIEEVTEISRGLAEMPKRFKCTVLALAQLSRQLENRDDKRPQLSDLRESGALEQDADMVLFSYRHAYYLEREGKRKKVSDEADRVADLEACKNTMEVIAGKVRQGAISSIKLYADMKSNRIMDMRDAMISEREDSTPYLEF